MTAGGWSEAQGQDALHLHLYARPAIGQAQALKSSAHPPHLPTRPHLFLFDKQSRTVFPPAPACPHAPAHLGHENGFLLHDLPEPLPRQLHLKALDREGELPIALLPHHQELARAVDAQHLGNLRVGWEWVAGGRWACLRFFLGKRILAWRQQRRRAMWGCPSPLIPQIPLPNCNGCQHLTVWPCTPLLY
jgi:hypothetical protein